MRPIVIIPCFNEEANIEDVVENLKTSCGYLDYVIVNDGSLDETVNICKRRHYNLLDLPINIGLKGAVQAGMKYAYQHGYDSAIQFDGDGQHNPVYIDKLIKCMDETHADIVIGSRIKIGNSLQKFKKIGSCLLSLLIKMTTNNSISDPTSGMRLYQRSIVYEIAYNLNYGVEPDTISYLMRNGAKVCEVGVEMNERSAGVSYLNLTRAIRYMLQMCTSIVFIQWFRREGGK